MTEHVKHDSTNSPNPQQAATKCNVGNNSSVNSFIVTSSGNSCVTSSSVCCEYFVDTLNKIDLQENEEKNGQTCKEIVQTIDADYKLKKRNNLYPADVLSFLNYCNNWQQK